MSNIVDQYRITQEPYYRPVADEVELEAKGKGEAWAVKYEGRLRY